MPEGLQDAQEYPRMQRTIYCLTAFMALIVVLTLFTRIDDRILDWEEFRFFLTPREGDSLFAFLKRTEVIGPLQPLNVWVVRRVFDGPIEALRIMPLLSALVALLFAVRFCPSVTGKKELAAFYLFALGMNAFFVDYARWGHVTYIVSIAYSIPMFYLFLRIHQGALTFTEKLLLCLGAALGVFLDRRTGSLLMITGTVTVLAAHFIDPSPARPPLRTKLKDLLCTTPFLLMFAIRGWRYVVASLPWLFQKDDTLLHSPTHYFSGLYFKFNADYPKTPLGLLHFYMDRTWDVLWLFFHPVGTFSRHVPRALLVLFAVAVVVAIASIIRKKAQKRTFVLLFLLIGLLGCYALNLIGVYPFGQPRYCLFLMYPAVTLAAFGLSDIVAFSTYLLRKRFHGSVGRIYMVLCVLLCCIAANRLYSESTLRISRGNAARDIISVMQSDTDLLLTIQRYVPILAYYAPENRRKALLLSKNAEEIRKRLADPECKIVTVITRKQTIVEGNPEVEHLLYEFHAPAYGASLLQDMRYSGMFRKFNVVARVFEHRTMTTVDLMTAKQSVELNISAARITQDGMFLITGWLIPPKGITEIRILAGDTVLGYAIYPTLRFDIGKVFPEYKTNYFGYVFKEPYSEAWDGESIMVEARAGSQVVARVRVNEIDDQRNTDQ